MAEIVAAITAANGTAVEFEIGFLKRMPIPLIEDPENPGQTIPKYATSKEWLKADIIDRYRKISNEGHKMIEAENATVIGPNDLV